MNVARVLLCLGLASACGPDRVAAIQVSVTTDIDEVSWLELRTLAQDGSRILSRGHAAWSPATTHTFNVVPRDNDLDANPDAVFELAAGSCAPADGRLPTACVLVTRRVRAPYVAGAVRVVRVALERACRGVPCPAPQTCVAGACADERTLRSAGDAGVLTDAGPDLIADAAPDRVVEADIGLDASADACACDEPDAAVDAEGPGADVDVPSGDADVPSVDASMVCRSAAMTQTCRPPENCCTLVGVIAACGCAVPLLGCIPRGAPGCN